MAANNNKADARSDRGARSSSGNAAPLPSLRQRFGLQFALMTPVVLLFALTLLGYLYFTAAQIRTALADAELHLSYRLAAAFQAELNQLQFEQLGLAFDSELLEFFSGSDNGQSVRALLNEFVQVHPGYRSVALMNSNGQELVSADGPLSMGAASGLAWSEIAADLPSPDAQNPQGSAPLFAVSIQPLSASGTLPRPADSDGPADRQALADADPIAVSALYLTAPTGEADYRLLVAADLSQLYADLAQANVGNVGDLWLLNRDGFWLFGGGPELDWGFLGPRRENVVMAARHPAIWQQLNSGFAGSRSFDGDLVGYASICEQISCTGLVGEDAIQSDWFLLSFLPEARLGAASLLGSQPGRWLPITSLLLLLMVLALFGTWILSSSLTRLRRNEKILQQANMLQDAFFEKNPEIMFVKNLDGSFQLANEMCREFVDHPDRELTGLGREALFPQDARSTMEQQDQQVIQREEAMEFHTRWRKDGVMYHFKTLRFPLYNQDNQLIAVGGIATDVTDQMLGRQALLENEKLLRTFIESAPDAVLICGTDGDITLVNRQAELIFGHDRQEMLQLSLFDLITELHPGHFKESIDNARRAGGEVFREAMESNGRGKNNRLFPVEFSLAPVNTDEGSLIICLLRDASEKALMETQLRQSQKMEAIGKLTGGMAHDFNNLLGIIIGNIALARRQVKDNERVCKRMDTAMKAAERGADLTKRMLAVARRQPLQPKAVAINSVIEDLANMLPQTLGSDIEMELITESDLPPIVVDESGFESMLLNLAINSRDAMPEGGKFTVRTDRKSQQDIESLLPRTRIRDQEFVHISVSDTGAGMTEEALNRAFEPFFTTKDKGKGTGLGLAMIYGFIKQSRGYIVIDSELGQGTTVHIYLPADTGSSPEAMETTAAQAIPFLRERRHTVLVVDDEVELLEIAEAYLEELGMDVLTAESGAEALARLEEADEVDLMITDVVMPGGMNGTALVKSVRDKYPAVKILYASGFPSGVIEENAGLSLDAPLVHKPYTRDALAGVIMKSLALPGEFG